MKLSAPSILQRAINAFPRGRALFEEMERQAERIEIQTRAEDHRLSEETQRRLMAHGMRPANNDKEEPR